MLKFDLDDSASFFWLIYKKVDGISSNSTSNNDLFYLFLLPPKKNKPAKTSMDFSLPKLIPCFDPAHL